LQGASQQNFSFFGAREIAWRISERKLKSTIQWWGIKSDMGETSEVHVHAIHSMRTRFGIDDGGVMTPVS
jgi:site-specific recombinase XerC